MTRATSPALADDIHASLISLGKRFNPNQLRDPNTGEWTDAPGGGGGVGRIPEGGVTVLPEPHGRRAPNLIEVEGDLGEWGEALDEAVEAIDRVNVFPDGTRTSKVRTAPRLRTAYGDFNPYTRTIRVNPKVPADSLGLLHEFGHSLDEAMSRRRTFFASQDKREKTPAMEKLLTTMRSSAAYKRIGERPEFKGQTSYWRGSAELFARAYAQYVAERGGVSTAGWKDNEFNLGTQWEADDFAPISEAMTELMREQGLAK